MCGPIIGIIFGVVGAFAQFAMASAQAKAQAEIEREQRQQEIEMEEIRSTAATADRLEELRFATATNEAALSAIGLNNNWSYEQGIAPYNQKVASRDIERDEYNRDQKIGRERYLIRVAQWRARAESRMALVDAFSDSLSTVGRYAIKRA